MKKILIVDDQVEVRELVDVTLRVGDHEILHAERGEQAVEIARREKPDLIIMDVSMPGEMDGLQATRAIKGDPETRNCTVIILSAKGQETEIRQGFDAGADDYFVKPFSPLDLVKKVEALLGESPDAE